MASVTAATSPETRTERDSMGEMTVPAHVLYGASTQRAVLNFPVSGRPVPFQVIHAFALLKKACAEANLELGKLDERRAGLITDACDEIAGALEGRQTGVGASAEEAMQHFPIDVFQTGSGTSTNMNANEVIANLAARAAGNPIGAKDPVHPNDHVNMGQSSNDTFPTAMQVAAAIAIARELIPALEKLAAALAKKAKAWDHVVKIGRTHLMDATPIRLGQEFSGFAAQAEYCVKRAERAIVRLAENLPIGGTAVGTGINTHPKFAGLVVSRLTAAAGVEFSEAGNHFEAQATRDCVVEASGELKTIAVSLSKIANDIRWLGSGPRAGLYELSLPATQPGSSIMPGKVNPVICESIMQVACAVIGHDATITLGGVGGVGSLLQLNVAMPVMAESLLGSITLLASGATILVDKCIDGLKANEKVATAMVQRSLMTVTALAPEIGYDKAAEAAKAAFASGQTIREYVLEHKLLDEKRLDELLDARSMTEPAEQRRMAPVLERIRALLDGHGVEYRHLHHEPTPTSEDSARARGEPIEIGGKALVIKAGGGFHLFVVSAARRLDSAAARRALGVKRAQFATPDELADLTGLVPGAVPPFGEPVLPLPLYVDRSVLANERIAFNAGALTDSIIMSVEDYRRVARIEAVVDAAR